MIGFLNGCISRLTRNWSGGTPTVEATKKYVQDLYKYSGAWKKFCVSEADDGRKFKTVPEADVICRKEVGTM